MTAIIEEATEEVKQARPAAARTRPATARVPSPRDGDAAAAPVTQVSGIADLTDGRGYLRTAGYRRSVGDIPLTASQVRQYGLRKGDQVEATVTGNRPSANGSAVNKTANGQRARE